MLLEQETFCAEKIQTIFQSEIYTDAPIHSKFLIILQTIFHVVSHEFSAVRRFYEDIAIRHLVRRLRAGIRLTMIYTIFGITELGVLKNEVTATQVALILMTIISSVILYCITSRMISSKPIFNVSFIILLHSFTVHILLIAEKLETQIITFMSGVMLLVALSLLLPIRYDVAVTLLILYVSAYLLSSWLPTVLVSERWTEEGYQTKSENEVYTALLVNILVWLTALISGIQLHLWNMLRYKFAFLYLADGVHQYNSCSYLEQRQNTIFKELLPKYLYSDSIVRHRLIESVPNQQETFIKQLSENNVGILRAELGNLWQFVNCRPGVERFRLLHKVFTIFGHLCSRMGCERLDVGGTAYVAFSILDTDKDEHLKNCIELGLVMCYAVKRLAHEYRIPLHLRVGVHSSKTVFSALMGTIRPRIDMFSDDMFIVEQLQSTSIPGRVHVADSTYNQFKDSIHFARGDPLQLVRSHGRTQLLDTYFVHPRSKSAIDSRMTPKDIEIALRQSIDNLDRIFGRGLQQETEMHARLDHRFRLANSLAKSAYNRTKSHEPPPTHPDIRRDKIFNQPEEHTQNQLTVQYLAINIEEAPEEFREQYQITPLNFRTMRFISSEAEDEYRNPNSTKFERYALDSDCMIVIADMISLTVHLFLFMTASYLLIKPSKIKLATFVILCICFACPQLITLLLFIQATMSPSISDEESGAEQNVKYFHRLFWNTSFHECLLFFQTLMPTLFLFLCQSLFFPGGIRHKASHELLISLEPLVYMTHLLATRSRFLFRIISLLSSALTFFLCGLHTFSSQETPCDNEHSSADRNWTIRLLELCATLYMIWTGCRENDFVCRSLFYQRRACNKQHANRMRMIEETKALSCCLVPERLYDRLNDTDPTNVDEVHQISPYWVESANAGVALIAVTNFRSSAFGISGDADHVIKLIDKLNQLIGLLDQLLSQSVFQELDKIKSWQHYYLVCSGLFLKHPSNSTDLRAHLVALLEYCLLVLHQLTGFNEQHFPDAQGFQLAIGYHTGPILAGIDGCSQMAFNVWGDTVSVAQTLAEYQEKTGTFNQILVHEMTTAILSHQYEFQAFDKLVLSTENPEAIYTCRAKIYA
ncbi:hypothetical protein FBUS_09671 [Fasciolopsis buskii]|uniref:adenylate cyclase n=1 Tax=Fasciolopsis buskii TaxID=27845 RepID=A0A8E0RP46_9TREM|nr:hypothetical protein FBUS_09671 [Fasciolopsis buski]